MHDIHEANKILKVIISEAKKKRLQSVKNAKLELGEIIEHGKILTRENLAFNIKMLAKGTLAEGLKVEIKNGEEGKWKLVEIESK